MRQFLTILLLFLGSTGSAEWSHIEYGAANVASGTKVVRPGDPLELTLLRDTLKKLVEQKGSKGTFYVNDLDAEMTSRAGNALKAYAIQQGWNDIDIRVLPGDCFRIDLPYTDTAHLKNPPADMMMNSANIAAPLQRLADHSRNGLQLVTSQRSFENLAVIYENISREGAGEKYIDPAGKEVFKPTSRYKIARVIAFPSTNAQSLGASCPILLHKVWEVIRQN